MSDVTPKTDGEAGCTLDEVVEAFTSECRRGEAANVLEWIKRHPAHAEDLAEILPAIRALEFDGATMPSTRPEDLTASLPERIGDFKVVREIGRGGMGIVFEAIEEPLGRHVALKVLPSVHLASAEARARFLSEALVAARLDHPNICPVYRAGTFEGIPFLAMRLIEGESLAARLADKNPVPSTKPEFMEVYRVVLATARALESSHLQGIVHRDIKPQNIMIDSHGQPIVLDFGLARTLEATEGDRSRSSQICGTPSYIAPEMLRAGRSIVDRSVDIYALGATFYECLTHRRVFEAPTIELLYQAILKSKTPDPRTINPLTSRDASAVIGTALEKEPSRRYQSVTDFAKDIEALIDGRQPSVKPPSAFGRLSRWARREPTKAALVLTLCLLTPILAGLTGYLIARLPEIERGVRNAAAERTERLLEIGFFELGERRREEPIARFREAMEEDPSCPEALAGLAFALLEVRRPEEVLATLDRSNEVVKRHPSLGVLRSVALKMLRKLPEAELALQSVMPPASAFDHFVLGMQELSEGHHGDVAAFGRAKESLLRATELGERQRSFYVGALGHAAMHCSDKELIHRTCRTLTTLWPESAASLTVAAFILQRTDVDRAEEYARSALAKEPDYFLARDMLSSILSDQRRFQEAEALLKELVAEQPREGYLLANLGFAQQNLGRFEEALDTGRRAMGLSPKNTSIRRLYARALWNSGRRGEAIHEYQAAAELEPQRLENWKSLGWAYETDRNFEGAIGAYERAVALIPNDSGARFGLGTNLMAMNRSREALPHLIFAAEANPSGSGAHNNLSVAFAKVGQLREAIASAWRAYELHPRDAEFIANLRGLLRSEGHLEGEYELARRRRQINGEDLVAAMDEGQALYGLNRYADAGRVFQDLVGRAPEHLDAWAWLAASKRQTGSFAEAQSALERCSVLSASRPEWKSPFPDTVESDGALNEIRNEVLESLSGSPGPTDRSERLRNAWIALVSGEPRLAQRLLAPFVRQEHLSSRADPEFSIHFYHTVAAAEVALDAADPASVAAERRSAHAFLQAQLQNDRVADWTRPDVRMQIRQRWMAWLHDPRLAAVRDVARLLDLPATEQRLFEALWDDARRLLEAL